MIIGNIALKNVHILYPCQLYVDLSQVKVLKGTSALDIEKRVERNADSTDNLGKFVGTEEIGAETWDGNFQI